MTRAAGAVTEALHLARRFFGAVRPGAPAAADESWALGHLGEGEAALWRRMNNPDRRHAITVARDVVEQLDGSADRAVVAAALLHDVGKIVSNYRTPARVAATLIWAAVPSANSADRARQWADRGRPFARLSQYRRHPELGEALLEHAGADPITSSWAADHHRPPSEWRIERSLGQVLKDCDDD